MEISQAVGIATSVIFAVGSDISPRPPLPRAGPDRGNQALKESPHEQVPVAFGLLMRNPRRSRPDRSR